MAKEWAKWFYNSKLWQDARDLRLKTDKYTCTEEGCYNVATEVHHIEELTPDNIHDIHISLNQNNLASKCSDCHKRITKMQKSKKKSHLERNIVFDESGYPVEHPPGGNGKIG